MPESGLIYKIASRGLVDAARASGRFTGAPLDVKDGYIHFSTASQLAETLRMHFAGQSGLVILAVRSAELGVGLRWEPARGGQLFPHLYGDLPMTAVVSEGTVDVAADGSVALPAFVT